VLEFCVCRGRGAVRDQTSRTQGHFSRSIGRSTVHILLFVVPSLAQLKLEDWRQVRRPPARLYTVAAIPTISSFGRRNSRGRWRGGDAHRQLDLWNFAISGMMISCEAILTTLLLFPGEVLQLTTKAYNGMRKSTSIFHCFQTRYSSSSPLD